MGVRCHPHHCYRNLVSFPSAVAERVLVACGRHCALCHKFCGLKIELHHIQQRSKGGPDTFENCIPLCFDCHADMRSYDHKHPKGRKYTEAELVAHRDEWYKRYGESGGGIASPNHIELDRATFLRIRRQLPYEGLMRRLRDRYGGAPIFHKHMTPLYAFLEDAKDPAYEFLDADLDSLRADLLAAIDDYTEKVVSWTFPSRDPERNTLPPEMKERDPELYYERVSALSRAEVKVSDAYDALVREARRKLGIDLTSDT
jgi:hypothetical protein